MRRTKYFSITGFTTILICFQMFRVMDDVLDDILLLHIHWICKYCNFLNKFLTGHMFGALASWDI